MLNCAPPKGETYNLQPGIMRVLRALSRADHLRLKVRHGEQRNIHTADWVEAELEAQGADVSLSIVELPRSLRRIISRSRNAQIR